jgi:hypothetical protein
VAPDVDRPRSYGTVRVPCAAPMFIEQRAVPNKPSTVFVYAYAVGKMAEYCLVLRNKQKLVNVQINNVKRIVRDHVFRRCGIMHFCQRTNERRAKLPWRLVFCLSDFRCT